MGSIKKVGQAGTLESNDIMITISPGGVNTGVIIELESIVLEQFGKTIQQVIACTIAEQTVTDVYIKATDRGALDCTIRARTLTALSRAGATLTGEVL